eukprot:988083-Rhodomonas_salina.4
MVEKSQPFEYDLGLAPFLFLWSGHSHPPLPPSPLCDTLRHSRPPSPLLTLCCADTLVLSSPPSTLSYTLVLLSASFPTPGLGKASARPLPLPRPRQGLCPAPGLGKASASSSCRPPSFSLPMSCPGLCNSADGLGKT